MQLQRSHGERCRRVSAQGARCERRGPTGQLLLRGARLSAASDARFGAFPGPPDLRRIYRRTAERAAARLVGGTRGGASGTPGGGSAHAGTVAGLVAARFCPGPAVADGPGTFPAATRCGDSAVVVVAELWPGRAKTTPGSAALPAAVDDPRGAGKLRVERPPAEYAGGVGKPTG